MRRLFTIVLAAILIINSGFSQDIEYSDNFIKRFNEAKERSMSPDATHQDHLWRTPLLLEATMNWDKLTPEAKNLVKPGYSLKSTADRPILVENNIYESDYFVFHYDETGTYAIDNTDGDASGYSDYVEGIAKIIDAVYLKFNNLGYNLPPADSGYGGDNNYDVYFGGELYGADAIESGTYGFVSPESKIGNNPLTTETEIYSYMSWMCLNHDYSWLDYMENNPSQGMIDTALSVTAAHEFMHSIQMGYNVAMNSWFMEACATWSEELHFPGYDDNFQYLGTFFTQPDVALSFLDKGDSPLDGHWYSTWILIKYLTEQAGEDIITDIYEIFLDDDNPILMIDSILSSQHSSSFDKVFENFLITNLVLDSASAYEPHDYERGNDYYNYLNAYGNELYIDGNLDYSGIELSFDSDVDGNGRLMRASSDYISIVTNQDFSATLTPDDASAEFGALLVGLNKTDSVIRVDSLEESGDDFIVDIDYDGDIDEYTLIVYRKDYTVDDTLSEQYSLTINSDIAIITDSTIILEEDFEGSVLWGVYDGDGNGSTWAQTEDDAYEGTKSVRVPYNSTAANNDWLTTTTLDLPDKDSLLFSFWARSYDDYYLESFNVKLTTNGTSMDITDYTVTVAQETGVPETWTNYTYDISDYAGQSIKLAVQCVSNDKWYLYLDEAIVYGITTDTIADTTTVDTTITDPVSFGTWEVIPSGTTSNDFDDVFFVNETTGWVVGENGMVLQSTDAGKSWTSIRENNDYDEFYSIWFLSETVGFATVGDYNASLGYHGNIRKTTDGGKNWTIVYDHTNYLYDIAFYNDNIGWAVGTSGSILYTSDGGENWSVQTSGITQNFRNVAILNSTTAIATTDGTTEHSGMLKTTNSGTTWAEIDLGNTYDYWGISFVNETHGWASSTSGRTFYTTNGGSNWTTVQTPVSEYLYDIHFASATNGIAVGFDGSIVLSDNGGVSWVRDSVNDTRLEKVFAINNHTAIVVGMYGTILRFSDGSEPEPEKGIITGTVTDATNGDPITGATVNAGGVTATTDGSGDFRLEVDSAAQIIVTATGFNNYENTISVSSSDSIGLNIPLSPTISGDQIRLVLTWGSVPADIDSYLKTPEIEGTEYTIYYSSKGDTNSAPYAILDLDDQNGYGPETVTIQQLQDGTYGYYVRNYSGTDSLSKPGEIQVNIYNNSGLIQTVIPPSTGTGRYWHVCNIIGENGNINIINEIMDAAPVIEQVVPIDSGLITGVVTDATNGDPIVGAVVTTGTASTTTNASGEFSLSVDTASQLNITATDYNDYSNTTIAVGEGDTVNFNIPLSPVISGNQIRLVLTWGSIPADVDSYLETPEIEGTQYTIYYSSKGDTTSAPYAILDLDDRNGYGPETVTIQQLMDGTYGYYIYNYSGTDSLSKPGEIQVNIYDNSGLIQTIVPPSSGSGRYWHVCNIDGASGNISIINEIMTTKPIIEQVAPIDSAIITGTITDATNGDPIVGAIISAGGESTTSGVDGIFRIYVDSASQIDVTADGFNDYSNTSISVNEGDVLDINIPLSPTISGNQIRLVLTWGAVPSDVDSYLETPEIEGTQYTIYYSSKGDTNSAPYAILDLDDQNGYGPETITIQELHDGTYGYYVYNFSGSDSLAKPGEIQVNIYDNSGLIQTIVPPSSGSGGYWHVCNIDGATGDITVINEIIDDKPIIVQASSIDAEFAADVTSGDAPLTVNFTDESTGDVTTWEWDFNNDGTVDATDQNPSYTYESEGVYTVQLVIGNGSVSDTITKVDYINVNADTTEGIESIALNSYNIYPNPSSGMVYVSVDNSLNSISAIQIISISGEVILVNSIKSNDQLFEIDMTSVEKGMYFLKLIEGNNMRIEKLIIE
ncbi:MXAN_6640 family putative metalloprotease [Bacteroidota bacterium]